MLDSFVWVYVRQSYLNVFKLNKDRMLEKGQPEIEICTSNKNIPSTRIYVMVTEKRYKTKSSFQDSIRKLSLSTHPGHNLY